MPKYWGKQILTHGKFPEVGQKQKTERKKKEREKERKRLNDGNNNGQATHDARKHSWRTQAAWAKNHAKPTHFDLPNPRLNTTTLMPELLLGGQHAGNASDGPG